jgi:hypothetical protein
VHFCFPLIPLLLSVPSQWRKGGGKVLPRVICWKELPNFGLGKGRGEESLLLSTALEFVSETLGKACFLRSVRLTSGWRWFFTSLRRVCPSVCLGLRFGPRRYDQHFQDLCSFVDIGFTGLKKILNLYMSYRKSW